MLKYTYFHVRLITIRFFSWLNKSFFFLAYNGEHKESSNGWEIVSFASSFYATFDSYDKNVIKCKSIASVLFVFMSSSVFMLPFLNSISIFLKAKECLDYLGFFTSSNIYLCFPGKDTVENLIYLWDMTEVT